LDFNLQPATYTLHPAKYTCRAKIQFNTKTKAMNRNPSPLRGKKKKRREEMEERVEKI